MNKNFKLYSYFIIFYFILYILSLFLIKNIDRKMYFYSLKNIDYFILHLSKFNLLTQIGGLIVIIIFTLFFPIIALFLPHWDKIFKLKGSFHCIPISINNNKNLCIKMQSKIFWYKS